MEKRLHMESYYMCENDEDLNSYPKKFKDITWKIYYMKIWSLTNIGINNTGSSNFLFFLFLLLAIRITILHKSLIMTKLTILKV